jgi:hypothetical protein
MIRHYAGLAIDCDSEDCDETYTDSVTMTLDGLRKFAKRDGWSISLYPGHGSDLCPACFEKAQDATLNNPPQDEGDNP